MYQHSLDANNKHIAKPIWKAFVLSSITLLSANILHADNTGDLAGSWYLGGSLGSSSMEPKTSGSYQLTDDRDTSVELYGGVNLTPNISLEGYWKDFGSAKVTSGGGSSNVDYSAMGVNGVYHAPIDLYGLKPFGKLGLATISTKAGSNVLLKQDKSTVITAGAGVEYKMTDNLRLRSEYNYYNNDLQDISLGMNWRPTGISVKPESKIIPAALPIIQPEAPQMVVQRPRPQPQPSVSKQVINTDLSGSSLFSSGSSALSSEGYATLNRLINQIQSKKIILHRIDIIGHTDNIGSHQANAALSMQRARAVASYLQRAGGISFSQMNIVGKGETQPTASNATPQGRAQNRRVSIKVMGAEVAMR